MILGKVIKENGRAKLEIDENCLQDELKHFYNGDEVQIFVLKDTEMDDQFNP
jgi:hypothetical protein